MNLSNQVSPELKKLLLVGVGAVVIFFVWTGIAKVSGDLQRQPILGESQGRADVAAKTVVSTLPIVQASTGPDLSGGANSNIPDELIESVFKVPEPKAKVESEPEEKKAPPKIPLSVQLMSTYRPVASGVSQDGVFMSGKHWVFGEEIKTMPLRNYDGGIIYPRVVGMIGGKVRMSVGGETLDITFERY